MKVKLVAFAIVGVFSSASAQSAEYVCKVYCDKGSTYATVTASSSSDAASQIDPTPVANRICQDADKGNASSSTMGSRVSSCFIRYFSMKSTALSENAYTLNMLYVSLN